MPLRYGLGAKKPTLAKQLNHNLVCLYLQSGYIYLLSYCLLSDCRHVGNLRVGKLECIRSRHVAVIKPVGVVWPRDPVPLYECKGKRKHKVKRSSLAVNRLPLSHKDDVCLLAVGWGNGPCYPRIPPPPPLPLRFQGINGVAGPDCYNWLNNCDMP